jgi:hypothetical protein
MAGPEMDHKGAAATATADAGPLNAVQATHDEKITQDSTQTSPLSSQKSNGSLAIRDAPVEEVQEKAHVTQDDHIAEEERTPEGEGLERVKSKHSVRDAGSIPNGGLWAWLQVLGGFFLLFNSWGIIVRPPSIFCINPFSSPNLLCTEHFRLLPSIL